MRANTFLQSFHTANLQTTTTTYTRVVRKVKNVCAYNPRSCFIVPDQSCGVFIRV